MRRVLTGIAVGAAALSVALPAVANAAAVTLTKGTVGGMPWEVTAHSSTTNAGASRLPALCMSFLFGQSFGSGPTFCIAPARGTTAAGPPWVFDIAKSEYEGLSPPGITRVGGSVRSILFFADPRTHRVVAWLKDGERLQIAAHPVPGSLHRPDAFAVAVTAHAPRSHSAAKVVRAVAYDAHGHVVGRMPTKKALGLPTYTYG
jgi:hypothetical protein